MSVVVSLSPEHTWAPVLAILPFLPLASSGGGPLLSMLLESLTRIDDFVGKLCLWNYKEYFMANVKMQEFSLHESFPCFVMPLFGEQVIHCVYIHQ